MLSKSTIALLRSLQQKKNRAELGLFVAEGEKLVSELLDSDFEIKSLYASADWIKTNSQKTKKLAEITSVTEVELEKISSLVQPQKVVAVAVIPRYELDTNYALHNYSIVLDGIRDPGNLGTIIRIADWFGIQEIICSPDTAEVWNPKVVQASMGSLLRVRVHEMDLIDFFIQLKQTAAAEKIDVPPVYGTFLEGNSIYSTKFQKTGLIVIGNEASGIRIETEKFVTDKINIPAWQSGNGKGAESLNAAVATAIVCSEVRRSFL